MDIKQCQVFLELAQSLHFGRAAELSNMSPSTVSRLVQRLEEEVGQTLLERDNRHVRLTPSGHHFLDYARKVVDEWQQLRSDFSRSQTSLSGEISVFGSVTASYSMFAQILPTLRQTYPDIEIKLRTGDQADGVERVLAGTEDCAIVALPENLDNSLEFLPLRTTPLKLYGPAMPSALTRLLDKSQDQSNEPDWSEVPMILAERGLARERLLQHLEQHHYQPNIYAQVAGHEAVVSMVSLGFGVALLPELVVQHSPVKNTIRELPWFTGLPPFRLGLCAVRSRLEQPLLKALWDCAADTHNQN